jgi:hypothetical protein
MAIQDGLLTTLEVESMTSKLASRSEVLFGINARVTSDDIGAAMWPSRAGEWTGMSIEWHLERGLKPPDVLYKAREEHLKKVAEREALRKRMEASGGYQ